jgi:probable HAF family extracellular repeat protein
MRKLWVLAMVAGLLLLTGRSRGEIRYSITDLGTLGGDNSYTTGINNSGQVVGSSETGGFYQPNSPVTHSFLFDGTLHDVSLVAQHRSDGNAINNLGHVAGMFEHTGFIYDGRFYRYVPNSDSTVSAINDSDVVVGQADLPVPVGSSRQAFRFDGITLQFLGTLGGSTSYATGINNAGVIVGNSETAEVDSISTQHISRAFIYDGSMHAIPGAEQGESSASDINDSGQIVGSKNGHAFMYDGRMHDLSPGPELSWAYAVNNFGFVVGEYWRATTPHSRFFIYDGSSRFLDDLIDKSLGYTLIGVSDINDSGQIAATAYVNSSYPRIWHAVLLTPIGPAVRQIFDVATPPESGAINSIRVYNGDKAEFWYSIMNANRNGAPDSHNGIYDSGQIYHPGSGIGLGQFTDTAGDSYLLIRITRMGDVNLDGQVSIADFLALASHFNSTGTWQEGDLNYDGMITIADFIALASNFGTSYSGEAVAIGEGDVAMLADFAAAHGVPEPTGVMVMLAGVTLELRRRRGDHLRDGEKIAEGVWE